MDDLRHLLPVLIPIIAIVMGISVPLVWMVLSFKRKQLLLEQNHKERLAAIERGIELPPIPAEVLQDERWRGPAGRGRWLDSPARQLRTGLFWLFVGVALGAALWVRRGSDAAVWALIPVAGGLAKLLSYALSPRLPATGNGEPD